MNGVIFGIILFPYGGMTKVAKEMYHQKRLEMALYDTNIPVAAGMFVSFSFFNSVHY